MSEQDSHRSVFPRERRRRRRGAPSAHTATRRTSHDANAHRTGAHAEQTHRVFLHLTLGTVHASTHAGLDRQTDRRRQREIERWRPSTRRAIWRSSADTARRIAGTFWRNAMEILIGRWISCLTVRTHATRRDDDAHATHHLCTGWWARRRRRLSSMSKVFPVCGGGGRFLNCKPSSFFAFLVYFLFHELTEEYTRMEWKTDEYTFYLFR